MCVILTCAAFYAAARIRTPFAPISCLIRGSFSANNPFAKSKGGVRFVENTKTISTANAVLMVLAPAARIRTPFAPIS